MFLTFVCSCHSSISWINEGSKYITPLEYIPNSLSILLIKSLKTQLQEKIGPCLKLKLLSISLDIKTC